MASASDLIGASIQAAVGHHQLEPAARQALELVLRQEADAILSSARNHAARIGSAQPTEQSIAFACKEHRFTPAASRSTTLEAARIMNTRPVVWPLGPDVRVPIDQAVAHRADVVLREPAVPSAGGGPVGGAVDAGHAALSKLHMVPITTGVPLNLAAVSISKDGSKGSGRMELALASFRAQFFEEDAPGQTAGAGAGSSATGAEPQATAPPSEHQGLDKWRTQVADWEAKTGQTMRKIQ